MSLSASSPRMDRALFIDQSSPLPRVSTYYNMKNCLFLSYQTLNFSRCTSAICNRFSAHLPPTLKLLDNNLDIRPLEVLTCIMSAIWRAHFDSILIIDEAVLDSAINKVPL
ncbi:hypothetical protein V8B55DRAFT_1549737 [Mucor lusitanicus]|uniref:Uncharacterized protein n=1 Tax=Mucor lusitanicus CBS 277.49 TaxID=747725 RepID=A0A162QZA0_MUCCL|nr:hypothetical protein MUCCIDRAFT_107442 [Mucor lusitanicus CBS 277.49]